MDPSIAQQPEIAALLAELENAISTSRTILYASVAATAVLVFDWMLTIDSEILLIWKAKWNYTKVFYLLSRYTHFVDFPFFLAYLATNDFSQSSCRAIYETGTGLFMLGVIFSELILMVRTWAVWAKGKYVAIGLFGTFALAWSAVLVLVSLYLKASTHLASPLPGIVGCLIEGSGTYMASIFVVIAGHDTIMLALMIARGIYAFRSGGDSSLLKTVYGDGIAFYIYLFILAVVNITVIFCFTELVVLLVMLQGAIHSILACRVLLHIRKYGRSEPENDWEMAVRSGGSRLKSGTRRDNLGLSESQPGVWQPLATPPGPPNSQRSRELELEVIE